MTIINSQKAHQPLLPSDKKIPAKMQEKLQELLDKADKGDIGASTEDNIQDIIGKIGDINKLPSKLQTRLERFLNKIDRNDDGHLSRAELRSMADTNNDGRVSYTEKKEMRAKLNDYLKDKAAIETLSSESSRQVAEAIEFLDEPSFFDETPAQPWPEMPTFPTFPNKPPKPVRPWQDGDIQLKYSTIFCTRTKNA